MLTIDNFLKELDKERVNAMTIGKIFEMGIIEDDTTVYVRDDDMNVLAKGNWFQDDVLNYASAELSSFTWQDDNCFYADIKAV